MRDDESDEGGEVADSIPVVEDLGEFISVPLINKLEIKFLRSEEFHFLFVKFLFYLENLGDDLPIFFVLVVSEFGNCVFLTL